MHAFLTVGRVVLWLIGGVIMASLWLVVFTIRCAAALLQGLVAGLLVALWLMAAEPARSHLWYLLLLALGFTPNEMREWVAQAERNRLKERVRAGVDVPRVRPDLDIQF